MHPRSRERRTAKIFKTKFLKKIAKIFADSKIVLIFAVPFERTARPSAEQAVFFSAFFERVH